MNDLEAVLEKNTNIKTFSSSTPIRFSDLAAHSRAQKGEDFKIANVLGLLTCHFSALKEVFCNTEMKRFTQQKISVATLLFLAGDGGSSFGHIRYFPCDYHVI